ncbi:MAG: hypothetical protein M1822_007894 [Bathelium mastoideum]|nr:MAG: hypothetical protein M1822_007894 [Bathelium mastoideum]
MSTNPLSNNRSIKILDAAEKGHYGIVSVVCYNIEAILAVARAAETQRSPAMILLFPWAIHYASSHLVAFAASVAHSASVPIALHLDHAASAEDIRFAADLGPEKGFDSIMVDMSHHEKAENLRLTKELTMYCHERGIAVEAEPGRIEGGEDGLKGTEDLEGMMTTPEEVEEFINTGIDFLAPAFGNVHGEYGPRGVQLEFDRLESIRHEAKERVRLVLHGTTGVPPATMQRCIEHGISKINVNKLIARPYADLLREKGGKTPTTKLMEEATRIMQERVEWQMQVCGSVGKA